MKNTTQLYGGVVAGVSLSAVAPVVAGVATSHLAGAVRLHVVDLNGMPGGVGRGTWRGQPSLGSGMSSCTSRGMSVGAPAAIAAVPAAKSRQLDRVTSKQLGNKQFRTVYEGPRPWKVPV
jgi:hypothetical protein